MLDHLNHAEQRINSQALTTEIGNKKGLCKMRGQKKQIGKFHAVSAPMPVRVAFGIKITATCF